MTDDFLVGITILIIAIIIFAAGACFVIDCANETDNQLVCKQLYQKDTNAYIHCNTKSIEENIKLIKDISDDK